MEMSAMTEPSLWLIASIVGLRLPVAASCLIQAELSNIRVRSLS